MQTNGAIAKLVRHWTATPRSPVQVRLAPPILFIAGVVQWLVHGLAKAGMRVRFSSLAPEAKIVAPSDV